MRLTSQHGDTLTLGGVTVAVINLPINLRGLAIKVRLLSYRRLYFRGRKHQVAPEDFWLAPERLVD